MKKKKENIFPADSADLRKKKSAVISEISENFFLLIFFILIFCSCEKVVEIPLNTTNPILVVEANFTNDTVPNIVKLTHTVDYYNDNVFPPVTGATVTISDDAGNSETLAETSSGIYKTSALKGVPGRTYTLKISADGKNYTAVSAMPEPVPIDTVIITPNKNNGGGFGGGGFGGGSSNNTYRIICIFTDPPGTGNYYRLQESSNDTVAISPEENSFRILSDKLTDGQIMSLSKNRVKLLIGDTVTAILQCINKSTYDFYNTVGNVQGENNPLLASPPANPVNNISNGGLGYFSAYSVSKKTAILQ